MKYKLKSFVALSSAICLTVALTTGCNIADRTLQPPNQAGTPQLRQNITDTTPRQGTLNILDGNRGGLSGMLPGITNKGGAANYETKKLNQQLTSHTGFDAQRADGIKRQLGGMSELQNSSVIVNGSTVLVGYKPSRTASNTNNIKNTLANKIRQMDNSITSVIATDSPNFVTEINKLANEIANNSQAAGLGDRFNKLIQNINTNNA